MLLRPQLRRAARSTSPRRPCAIRAHRLRPSANSCSCVSPASLASFAFVGRHPQRGQSRLAFGEARGSSTNWPVRCFARASESVQPRPRAAIADCPDSLRASNQIRHRASGCADRAAPTGERRSTRPDLRGRVDPQMLEKLSDVPAGVVGLRAVGRVSKKDYEDVLEPLRASHAIRA